MQEDGREMNKTEKIMEAVHKALQGYTGEFGFGFYDFTSGEECYLRKEQSIPTASVFKIYLLTELFRQVAQLEGLPPKDCILFDDSPDYCAAAKQAGWQVIGVQDSLFDYRADELKALCGEDRYLNRLSSYIPFL